MTLKKSDMVSRLTKAGFNRRNASVLVERVIEIIKSTLAKGESLLISGFGRFEVRDKTARKGRNPTTGEKIDLNARRVVVFRPSPRLKDKMNAAEGDEPVSAGGEWKETVPRVVYVCDICGEKHCICHKEK